MSELLLPPHDRGAERAVLGALMRDPVVLSDVLAVVRPEAMYEFAHRAVFEAIVDLDRRNEPFDLVNLAAALKRRGSLADVGGREYLVDLWQSVPTGAEAVIHAKLVRDAALLRGLIHVAHEIIRDAHRPTMSAEELIGVAERRIQEVTNGSTGDRDEPRPVGEVARDELAALEELLTSGAELAGLPSGFADLDQFTGGFDPGDLIVIGARPSVGKTALALNIAERVARAGTPVLFFSLEMPDRQIARRALSMKSGVPMHRMARPRDLCPDDIEALTSVAAASGSVGSLPLHLFAAPGLTADRVRAVSRRARRRLGVGLIVIDYLGLMRPENPRDMRSLQVGTLVRRMKDLATELKVPVLLLSQLNRNAESEHRRPGLSDLRESGDIEQDADRVLLLHRDPNLPTDDAVWSVEVLIKKNRNGPVGEIALDYRRPVLRFENPAILC